MADSFEQHRRWEEHQRRERQRQEQQRFDQQRRDQQRRDQEGRNQQRQRNDEFALAKKRREQSDKQSPIFVPPAHSASETFESPIYDVPAQPDHSRGHIFQTIDKFFLTFVKRFRVAFAIAGAIGGLIYGWYSQRFFNVFQYWGLILLHAFLGSLITFFGLLLLRPLAKFIVFLLALATVGGIAYVVYRLIQFATG